MARSSILPTYSLVALLGLLTSAGLAVATTVMSEYTGTDASVLEADAALERLGDLDQRISVDFAIPTPLEGALRSVGRAEGIKIWWGDIPPQVILPEPWTGDMTVKEALLYLADEFDLIYKVRQPGELMVCPGAPSSCWVTTPVAAAELPPRLPILLHSVNQPIELHRVRNAHNQRSLAFYFDEAHKRYLVELDLQIDQLSPREEPPFRIVLDMPKAYPVSFRANGNISVPTSMDIRLRRSQRVIGSYTPGVRFSFALELDMERSQLQIWSNGTPLFRGSVPAKRLDSIRLSIVGNRSNSAVIEELALSAHGE